MRTSKSPKDTVYISSRLRPCPVCTTQTLAINGTEEFKKPDGTKVRLTKASCSTCESIVYFEAKS